MERTTAVEADPITESKTKTTCVLKRKMTYLLKLLIFIYLFFGVKFQCNAALH
jgi:hypothetical protein